jgi:hypothetical protein
MTVPVWKKGLGLQRIDRVKICREGRWARKHVESLKNAYEKAPYFEDHSEFVEGLFFSNVEKIADLNLQIIRYLLDQLQIKTKLVLLSELDIEAQGDRLLIELCEKLGADCYLTQKGAKKYLNESLFQDTGIKLDYFRPPSPIYPQLWGTFIPNLSAFDLLFNCGPKAGDVLINA